MGLSQFLIFSGMISAKMPLSHEAALKENILVKRCLPNQKKNLQEVNILRKLSQVKGFMVDYRYEIMSRFDCFYV